MPSALLPPGRNVSRPRVAGATPADAVCAEPRPAAITTAATAASFLNRLNMTLSLREDKVRPSQPGTQERQLVFELVPQQCPGAPRAPNGKRREIGRGGL